ncbi:hypothetical protein FOZ62_018342, partial [Perkinsus olseni]
CECHTRPDEVARISADMYQGEARDSKTVWLILEPSRREVVLEYETINGRDPEFWDRNPSDSRGASKPESDSDALTGGKINAKKKGKRGVKMAKSIIKGPKGKIKGKFARAYATL